jgi:hypothetical protein
MLTFLDALFQHAVPGPATVNAAITINIPGDLLIGGNVTSTASGTLQYYPARTEQVGIAIRSFPARFNGKADGLEITINAPILGSGYRVEINGLNSVPNANFLPTHSSFVPSIDDTTNVIYGAVGSAGPASAFVTISLCGSRFGHLPF